MDLTDIYRRFCPKTKGYTFFLAPHGTFSKIDHIIGHKTGLNRYKNIENVPCILSGQHGPRLIFNNIINNRKPTFTWKLKNTLLNDTLVKEGIKKDTLFPYTTLFRSKEYTFFSAPHRTFSKIDHIIGHKAGLNRYKNIEIVPCILSDHHGLRLILNNNINNGKQTFMWKLNNTILNDTLVRKE